MVPSDGHASVAKRKFDPHRDRQVILQHATRRQVARHCRQQARTVTWLATALGMEDGALRGTVKQMAEWGVLVDGADSSPSRRTFGLHEGWRQDLDEALGAVPPQDLLAGGRAILVEAPGTKGLPKTLPTSAAWLVEFKRQKLALLGLLDSATAAEARRASDACQDAGLVATALRVTAARSADGH